MRLLTAATLGLAMTLTGTGASAQPAAEPVRVHAAGSLRAAFTEIGTAFEARTGQPVRFEFGPSGLLRDRLLAGEPGHVFASANMEHPRALARAGRAGTERAFTRNAMCALVAPGVPTDPDTLLDTMLDARWRLGTSTPKADPSGDYALEVFRKAEALRPGSFERLSGKAMTLTGGAGSPTAPAGRSVYAMLVADGRADLFLTYCTNAAEAVAERPALRTADLPAALAVGADYGITVLDGAPPAAAAFVAFLDEAPARTILRRHGFR